MAARNPLPGAYWETANNGDQARSLAAWVDGVVPFWDPFGNNDVYDPCDAVMQQSKFTGQATRTIVLIIAGLRFTSGTAAELDWPEFIPIDPSELGLSEEQLQQLFEAFTSHEWLLPNEMDTLSRELMPRHVDPLILPSGRPSRPSR
jgi:hypothetical protein